MVLRWFGSSKKNDLPKVLNSDPTKINYLVNPRRDYRFSIHKSHLEKIVDIKNTIGLEIGAHDLPFVQPDEGNCDFADFRTTAELRDLAQRLDGHNPDFVVEVKYDLRNGYEEIKCQYDWIAAAHVIEHVPDLIWWLDKLSSLLKDGGLVFLVIPDKRYTFDFHRRETNMSDLIDNNRQALGVPSYRQVFDHHFYSTPQIDPGKIWSGTQVSPPYKDYHAAKRMADLTNHGFEDAHCSVFTPESFTILMNDLTRAGLSNLKIADVRSTNINQLDFSAVLIKN